MRFVELMQSRYTTKLYDSSKRISDAELEELEDILRLSPSSINSQPWCFTIVKDKEKKLEFAKASFFNLERIDDSCALIILGRRKSVERYEEWMDTNLPEGAVEYYNTFLKPKGEEQIREWFARQVYLALGVLLSACAAMGIDSTPMEGIDNKKYDALLGDEDCEVLCAVAIGYRNPDDNNQPHRTPKERRTKEEEICTL